MLSLNRKIILLTLFLALPVSGNAGASQEIKFQSEITRTTLLELYTSEGCSSCPAAEQWLSRLKNSPDLWKKVTPLAFHIDYWDRLGWADVFASKEYTKRQYAYTDRWKAHSVYTPMFVRNGEEFRAWYGNKSFDWSGFETVGVLTAVRNAQGEFHVTFLPQDTGERRWKLHGARIGFGAQVKIEAGENVGKTLTHDFAVLDFQKTKLVMEDDAFGAQMIFSKDQVPKVKQTGVVFWVTRGEDIEPVQSVGGFLPGEL